MALGTCSSGAVFAYGIKAKISCRGRSTDGLLFLERWQCSHGLRALPLAEEALCRSQVSTRLPYSSGFKTRFQRLDSRLATNPPVGLVTLSRPVTPFHYFNKRCR